MDKKADMEEIDLEPALQGEVEITEAVPRSERAPSPADLPPDYGNPGTADFADPAWDDITDERDEGGEEPDPDEPDDTDEEPEDEGDQPAPFPDKAEDKQDELPVVPPGIEEDQVELADPDEPDDYDPTQ